MCITIDQACGFVLLNKHNTFVYCCKTCSREFALGPDFEVHVLSKHNRDDDDSVDVCGDIFAECTSDSMQIEATTIKIEQYEEHEYPPFDSVNHEFDNDIGNNESVSINPSLSQDLLPENSGEYLLEIKIDELTSEINTNATAVKRKRGRPVGWRKEKSKPGRPLGWRKEKIKSEDAISKESKERLPGLETIENSIKNPDEILNVEPVEIRANETTEKRQRTRPLGKKKKQISRNVAMLEESVQKSPECPFISFQCYMCPDKSFTKKGLKNHMRIHLRPRRWKRKQINSSAAMSENSITYQCEMCPGKIFSKKRGLKSHMHFHIWRLKSKKCDICNIIPPFYDKHMRSHMEHKCDYCDKTFKYKRNKIEHMRNHTGEKRLYLCGVCGKSYRNTASFYAHKLAHSTEQKKHKCPECGKEFLRKFTMTEHIIQCHTDSRPFTCNICGGSFATNRYLRNHRNVHKKENACRCCGKKFRYPYLTAEHERAVHGMIIPQSKLEDETSHN